MKLTSLLQIVDKLHQASRIINLQQACGDLAVYHHQLSSNRAFPLFQKAENENEERKKQEEAQRQAEIIMRNQTNKAKTLPSIETAWNYTNDSDAYDDDEEDDDSSSGGSDSS